jgi:SET domain-containing protein
MSQTAQAAPRRRAAPDAGVAPGTPSPQRPARATRPSAADAAASAVPSPAAQGRRIQVRRSGVHGKGVFALREIPAGSRILEYTGERIGWREALRRHPHDPLDPHHTFYFSLEAGGVIDAKVGGNAARWINHACEPNCEAEEVDGRVWIKALRDLHPGEELFYDYGLVLDERQTPAVKRQYACRCGAPSCRSTMLAPRRRRR